MNPGFFISNSEGTTSYQDQQLFVFNFVQKVKNIIVYRFIPANPQDERKERSHERLGKCKKKAKSREPITLCHENEEVYAPDFDAA